MTKINRIKQIEYTLRQGGKLDKQLWTLGVYLTCNRIPYAQGEKSIEIMGRWRKKDINIKAVEKFEEWIRLSEKEKVLENELKNLKER